MVSYIPGISATGSLAPGLTPAAVRAVLDLLSSAEIAAAYMPLAGGVMAGDVDFDSNNITNVGSITANVSIQKGGVEVATENHVHGNISKTGAIGSTSGLPVLTGASGVLTVGSTTGSGTVVVLATSPTLISPVLGTPTSGTLTNCTGLPVSTGISGLATGVATFLGTPTSANLAAAVTNETGSGSLVFANSPTLTTPNIGAATCSGLTCVGSMHTLAIGTADSSYDATMSVGTHLLFHSTTYGVKAAIGFNNSGVFRINNIQLGPSTVFSQVVANGSGNIYNFSPHFCTDNTSGQEKGMYSTGGNLYLTVNRGDQLIVSSSGVTINGWLDAAHRPYTVAGLPLASANAGKTLRVTDSTLAMTSANYGSTPTGGGSNNARVYSTGSAWIIA